MMRDFLRVNGLHCSRPLNVHLVPAGGVRRKRVTSRVVLCGDAAGYVDAFSGEGLAYAIRSGQIAVEVIEGILHGEPGKNTRLYEAACDREFGENLKYARMLSRLMHGFPRLFFSMFTGSAQVVERYLEVAAQARTYKSFLKWLIPRVPRHVFFPRPRTFG
jgi:flavin-dependent dehydrogenase